MYDTDLLPADADPDGRKRGRPARPPGTMGAGSGSASPVR